MTAYLDQTTAAADLPADDGGEQVRDRLLSRVRRSKASQQGIVTIRDRHAGWCRVADGVRSRRLLQASGSRALRAGEALQIVQIELAPGSRWSADPIAPGHCSEWLVQRGELLIDGQRLGELDHCCRAAGDRPALLQSLAGCLLHVTDSGPDGPPAGISRAADAEWLPYVPGVVRRILWCHQGQVAFIARASAGAVFPPHQHDHDEQCLMLAGELYASDILLRAGEFQLAQAGAAHGIVEVGSAALAYLRGDSAPRLIQQA